MEYWPWLICQFYGDKKLMSDLLSFAFMMWLTTIANVITSDMVLSFNYNNNYFSKQWHSERDMSYNE